jgi:hypothetical protein
MNRIGKFYWSIISTFKKGLNGLKLVRRPILSLPDHYCLPISSSISLQWHSSQFKGSTFMPLRQRFAHKLHHQSASINTTLKEIIQRHSRLADFYQEILFNFARVHLHSLYLFHSTEYNFFSSSSCDFFVVFSTHSCVQKEGERKQKIFVSKRSGWNLIVCALPSRTFISC